VIRVALVTGGASGIGKAVADRLRADRAEVIVVDVAADPGADVGDPEAWARVVGSLARLDVAFLNAGTTTRTPSIVDLDDDEYRRVLRANVDGVVFGIRAVVPLIERSGGGDIVVTASLAGLTAAPGDPIYTGTKHFVVGLVRSLAPQLVERGIRINAICPGFADTPLVPQREREQLVAAGFPLLTGDEVAHGFFAALGSGETGQAWVCQPGREPEMYRFRGVPGPRTPGAQGMRPPIEAA
jgi:NAD(P)-dependent dehydrogenase (short-subunit alcohol dehydrogenase family)